MEDEQYRLNSITRKCEIIALYALCRDQNTCLDKGSAMVRKGLKIEELRMNL